MELKDILAISGQPGLYKYVAQSTRGVIVESLLDGKRQNVSATAKVSALTEISLFTEPAKLKAYFAAVLPEYDRERVHVSDMKKCFAWYNTLVKAGFTEFRLPSDEAQEEQETAEA